MIKKLLSALLSIVLAGSAITGAYAAEIYDNNTTDETPSGFSQQSTPLQDADPEQIEYITQYTNGNKAEYYTQDGVRVDPLSFNAESEEVNQALPSSYNLKDYNRVTPVKNQGSQGLCWMFASMASMESSVLSQPDLCKTLTGTPDFSEGALSYYIYTPIEDTSSPLHYDCEDVESKGGDGGFTSIAANGVSGGYGVYPSEYLPYSQWNDGYPEEMRNYSLYRLKNYEELSNDIPTLKQRIIDGGALTVSYSCYSSNYYTNGSLVSYYDSGFPIIPSPSDMSHVVAVVGWDDNYSRENFSPDDRPEKDGAWLCKNSWGEDWGCTDDYYKGYFWMSYETKFPFFSQFEMQSGESYDNIYQHQLTAGSSENVTAAANVFTAERDETLTRISVNTLGFADCTAEVYLLNDDYSAPDDGQLLTSFETTIKNVGIHSFEITDRIDLKKGDIFSVVFRCKSNSFLGFNNLLQNYKEHGKSYLIRDNDSWTDVADINGTERQLAYSSIKAFTVNKDKIADKTKLTASIEEAEKAVPEQGVDPEIIAEQEESLAQAKEVLGDETAGQYIVNNAEFRLNSSTAKLKNYYYHISSAEDFMRYYRLAIKNNTNLPSQRIILDADIDLTQEGTLLPMFSDKRPFSGVFEGNGHKITGASIVQTDPYSPAGLFASVKNGTIKNLALENFYCESTSSTGVIAGQSMGAVIENCTVRDSKVTAYGGACGFISGSSDGDTIKDCNVANCTVRSANSGGIYYSGYQNTTEIINCSNSDCTVSAAYRLTDNENLTLSVDTHGMGYPLIERTPDNKFTIESLTGNILSITSEDAVITQVGDVYQIESDRRNANIDIKLDMPMGGYLGYATNFETREQLITAIYSGEPDIVIPTEIGGLPVTSIYKNAILYCKESLNSLTIPGTIKNIPDNIFANIYSLTHLTLSEGVETVGSLSFSQCSSLSSINFPDSLVSVGNNAFSNNFALKSVSMGDSLKSLGDGAFSNCSSLESVNPGKSVESIGKNAFAECTKITDITIPDSTKTVGDGAFSGCIAMRANLGKNITSIGKNAFGYTTRTVLNNRYARITDFAVNGYGNTAAESYCKENGIRFVDLNTSKPDTTTEVFDYGVFIKGDVDGDLKVSIRDVAVLQQKLAGLTVFNDIQEYNALVINCKESITINNATTIQQYLAKYISDLDYGGKG